jgi:hypothetical protein
MTVVSEIAFVEPLVQLDAVHVTPVLVMVVISAAFVLE